MTRSALTLLAAGLVSACASSPAGPVTEAGELDTDDGTLVSGEFQDSYSFHMDAGQWVRVELRSTAFDPYVIVRPTEETQHENDDMPEGDARRSEVIVQAVRNGQVEILVTSYDVGELGPYALVYEVTDAQPDGDVTPLSDTSDSDPVEASADDVPTGGGIDI